ncbi:hypothetical protein ACPA9J_15285 [Pseudomonas aeruginosa]
MPGGGPNFGWTFYAPLSTTFAPHSVTSLHLRHPPGRDQLDQGRDQA